MDILTGMGRKVEEKNCINFRKSKLKKKYIYKNDFKYITTIYI